MMNPPAASRAGLRAKGVAARNGPRASKRLKRLFVAASPRAAFSSLARFLPWLLIKSVERVAAVGTRLS
jgi:hypothetical protein